MRVKSWNYILNNSGVPVSGASVSILLAGTSTPAYVYTHPTTETFTNTTPQITTDVNGYFEFWIGDLREVHGYDATQTFKISWTAPSLVPGSIDDINLFPILFPVDETNSDSTKNKNLSNLLAKTWQDHITSVASDPHNQYLFKDGTKQLTGDWDVGTKTLKTMKITARDSAGLSLENSTGGGIIIADNGEVSTGTFNIQNTFKIGGITVHATASEINNLRSRSFGGSTPGSVVTIDAVQTLSGKKITNSSLNSDTALIVTSEELNQLHGVDLSEIIAGEAQAFTNLQNPKINSTGICISTSEEINQLHDVVVGGADTDDITTNDGVQTLLNKTLTNPKINSSTPLTATSSELNAISGKVLVTTTDAQTLSGKTLVVPVIPDFSNAGHNHVGTSTGGQISHSSLTNLGNNDHPQYGRSGSNETITGLWTFSQVVNGVNPSSSSHLATKAYVDAAVTNTSTTTYAYYVTQQNVDQSDGNISNTIQNIINTAGSNNVTMIFNPNTTYNITANSITIPSTIQMIFHNGGVINVASGKTLTINGFITAQNTRIFSGSGTVNGSPKTFVLYPEWFGMGTGSSSSTNATAIQKCIDLAVDGSAILFSPGDYQIAGPITVSKGISFQGPHESQCKLIEQSTDNTMFIVSTGNRTYWDKLSILGRQDLTRTATGILLGSQIGESTVNVMSYFSNLIIGYHGVGIKAENAAGYTINDCYIVNNRQIGVDIWNMTNSDNGDMTICNCTFDTMYASEAAIKYHSGGGLRVQNNKILAHQYGIRCYFESMTQDTSILLIQDNSIENQTIACIHLDRDGSYAFSEILITNNQLTAGACDGIKIDDTFTRCIITGNDIRLGTTNKTCIWIGQGTKYVVTGNILDGQGIALTYGVTNVSATRVFALGKNLYANLSTNETNITE